MLNKLKCYNIIQVNPVINFTEESNRAMKDRELIEELENLEEIIGWLEEREHSDLKMAIKNVPVDRDEVIDWISTSSEKTMKQ
jgi:hypothetical protein